MADIDDNDIIYQDASPATPPKGFKVNTTVVNGAHVQGVIATDIHGHKTNVQAVTDSITGDEYGLVTNAIIHGRSTSGGGSWVDVKVSPSGAVQIGGDLDSVATITNVVEVSDNGGSLTVDDGAGSLTVDGSVSVSNFPATYPVTDNNGSLTVDGTVAATQSGTWTMQLPAANQSA